MQDPGFIQLCRPIFCRFGSGDNFLTHDIGCTHDTTGSERLGQERVRHQRRFIPSPKPSGSGAGRCDRQSLAGLRGGNEGNRQENPDGGKTFQHRYECHLIRFKLEVSTWKSQSRFCGLNWNLVEIIVSHFTLPRYCSCRSRRKVKNMMWQFSSFIGGGTILTSNLVQKCAKLQRRYFRSDLST